MNSIDLDLVYLNIKKITTCIKIVSNIKWNNGQRQVYSIDYRAPQEPK